MDGRGGDPGAAARAGVPLTVAKAVLAVAIVAATAAASVAAMAAASVTATAAAPVAGQDRPFRHPDHQALACLQCHPSGAGHRTPQTWAPARCAACHHDPDRGHGCASCHDASNLPGARTVTTTLSLSVWEHPRTRDLPFEHPAHAEARTCGECHQPPISLATTTSCATCHVVHDRPEAECALCHRPALPDVHGLPAHLSCAGSGCHAPEPERRLVLSRPLCLTCHVEQREHHPGRSCQTCHQIPELHAL